MTAILVADDDMDIRDLVALKLERAGFEVTAVDDGPAALTAARQVLPDLVVLGGPIVVGRANRRRDEARRAEFAAPRTPAAARDRGRER